jgi:hypothetical protein
LNYDNLKSGHCLFSREDIATNKIDLSKLSGTWLNIFDRKEMNDQFKCGSISISQYDGVIDEKEEANERAKNLFDVK